MERFALKILLVLAMIASLSACSRDGSARNALAGLRQSAIAPDEFLVVPQKPLETPSNLSTLPTPAPGQANRVTIDFEQNLLQALGGRGAGSGRVTSSEAAFIKAARGSVGVTENIRDVLRAEDLAFREAHKGQIERLARQREAASVYDVMLLDPLAEVRRLRSLGIKAPTVPAN